MAAIKLHTLSGHPVDAGAGCPVIAIAAEMVGSQRIDIKIEDAHRGGDDQKNQRFGLISIQCNKALTQSQSEKSDEISGRLKVRRISPLYQKQNFSENIQRSPYLHNGKTTNSCKMS